MWSRNFSCEDARWVYFSLTDLGTLLADYRNMKYWDIRFRHTYLAGSRMYML